MLGEGGLAEAVDGRDRHAAQLIQRLLGQFLGFGGGELCGLDDLGQFALVVVVEFSGFDAFEHLTQALTHLQAGGLGEGHHQDFAGLLALLQDQADHDPDEAVGLAGASAGLDRPEARFEGGFQVVKVFGFAHRFYLLALPFLVFGAGGGVVSGSVGGSAFGRGSLTTLPS